MKFHFTRHVYTSALIRSGADLRTMADLLGHDRKSIARVTVGIYSHTDDYTKRSAVHRLEALYRG
jgi:site-specific recombinase XerD